MIVIGSTVIRDISIASAKEVLFSSALQDHAKNTQTVSRNSMERWYMGHGKNRQISVVIRICVIRRL